MIVVESSAIIGYDVHFGRRHVGLMRGWAVLVLLLAAPPCHSASQWIKVSSPHFEMFTSAAEGAAKRTIQDFEQIRSFFVEVTKAQRAPSLPVRIIAFRSRKEFDPYRARESSSAYYLAGHDRDYIVMGKIGVDTRPVAIHEYIHLLVRHSGLKLPVWLNEGFADLYSTLKPYAGKILVGELLPGRFQLLQRSKWLTLETLLAADHDSAHYNEKDRMGLFYAQSWALAHMLNLHEQYRAQFSNLVSALSRGQNAEDAFRDIYGKPLERVEKDLRLYLKGDRFTGALFDAKLVKLADKPAVQPATELESGLVLANLMAQTRERDQAREMYEALAAKYPDVPEIPAALGYLSTYGGDWDKAAPHFARAAELGTTNAKLLYDYAQILSRKDRQTPEIEGLLRRAIELLEDNGGKDYQKARYRLAFHLYARERYAQAVIEFSKLGSLTPEQAFSFYQAVAHANIMLGRKEEGRRTIELARSYAKSPDEISRVEDLTRWIDWSDKADEEKRLRETAAGGQDALASAGGLAGGPGDTRRTEETSGAEHAADAASIRQTDDDEFSGAEMPRLIRHIRPMDGLELRGEGSSVELWLEGAKKSFMEGKFTGLDCLGERGRMWLETATGDAAFLISDPSNIVMRNSGSLDLECGPQDPRAVKVEYVAKEDAKLQTVGEVVSIEFR